MRRHKGRPINVLLTLCRRLTLSRRITLSTLVCPITSLLWLSLRSTAVRRVVALTSCATPLLCSTVFVPFAYGAVLHRPHAIHGPPVGLHHPHRPRPTAVTHHQHRPCRIRRPLNPPPPSLCKRRPLCCCNQTPGCCTRLWCW